MHEKHGFRVLIIYVFTLALSSVEGVKYMPETVERSQTHENPPWETDDRLPNSTYAEHYDLYLHPDLESKFFTGHVTIRISSSESRDYFLVHANLLTINKDTLNLTRVENQNAKTVVPIVKAFKYSPNEFFVIETDIVPPGTYELFLEFGGSLEGKIVGFYFSEYTTKSGEKRPLATSKFQPTFARQAFPCFDEPSFRSTFTITIVRPSDNNYIGLSNMPVKNEVPNSPSPELTEVHFEKSVSMVTYLVCFIVSDFTYKEVNKTTMDGLMPFRVYASRDKIDDMQYALDFGSKVLLFFEDMFDYPFPLPKSDMAAIPDYSSGATEHWGIITYRETRIFYNENTSSSQDYESTSHVIAHELAHQWFGNLVTLEWWNDLWLNEGFASFIEYKGVDHEHPSWDAKSQFVTDRVQDVFDLDSQLSSHPIVKTVETPEEITAMFDSISYDKGASVLRMLEGFMGESDFQKGINQFLKDYAFKNAVTQDLWNELTAAWKDNVPKEYKTDIGEIMNSWTMQMGYPVVNVQRNSPTQLTVTQSRFLKDPNAVSDPSNSTFGYKWDIPISLVTSNEPNRQDYWLYRENEKLLIDIEEGVTWYKLNYRQVGYYRVNYSPDIWGQLQVLCADLSLTAEDRSSLYDDALALADAALLDYGIALNMTLSLVNENHYVPWKSASKRFEMMEYLLLGTNVLAPFKSYVRELVEPIYEVLHWQDAGIHLERLLRYVIVDVASMSDVESSLDEAGKLLQSWIDDESYPSPLDTKRYAYWWGMIKSGSDANWNIMWERCLAELDPAQKNNLYYGLSNSQDPEILNKYIELTFDLDNTRMQDFLSILQYIALNPIGMDLSWDWIRSNWDALLNRYGPDDRYLGQLIPSVTQYFATSKKLAEMEVFYRVQANNGTAVLYRDQALETVKSNIFWVNTYSPVILAWLNLREKQ